MEIILYVVVFYILSAGCMFYISLKVDYLRHRPLKFKRSMTYAEYAKSIHCVACHLLIHLMYVFITS